jgi:ubiquinone/menaquinone biosynthesis C-methylase UbiE
MDRLFGRYRRRAVTADRTPERRQEPAQGQGIQVDPDDAYLLGVSDAEISRLDFQHYMFRLAFTGDYSAPLQAPQDMLDVACGTGRWAREMARRFATANVIGFDINRGLMEASLAEGTDTLPDNCTFLLGDALQPLQFADASFDFVVARACSAFIPVALWPQVVGEMARVTRPGGWVELRDFGLARSNNAALNELTVKFANFAQSRGIHPGAGPFLKQYLEAARLRDVRVHHVLARSGTQGGTRAGQLMLTDYLALLDRVAPMVARSGIETAQHWQALIMRARNETRASPDDHYAEVELTAGYGRREV